MKISQKNKIKLYVGSFAFVFGLLFCDISGVKAETIVDIPINNGVVTIPEYSDGSMFICTIGTDGSQFTIDSTVSTQLAEFSYWGSPYFWINFYYVSNLTSGNHSITGLGSTGSCFFVSGLTLENQYTITSFDFLNGNFSNPYNLLIPNPYDKDFYLFSGFRAWDDWNFSASGGSVVHKGKSSNFTTLPYVHKIVTENITNQIVSISWDNAGWSAMKSWVVSFNTPAVSVVPDTITSVWGYFNFQSKYQCNRGKTCRIRYFYNTQYIPSDTNEIIFSDGSGSYPYEVIATSTIEDLNSISKFDGRSYIDYEISSTTPRGTYKFFVNAENQSTSTDWVFSSPIYIEVFNEDEYLNPYPEVEEFNGWGSEWYFKLLSIFPFNIPTSFIIAWNNSQTALLPEDLEFLRLSEDSGDFNASFPKQWLGTPADMEFTLFGYDKIVNGSSRMILLLDNFRKFTTFLQWMLFVWAFWSFAKLVIDNLNVSVSESGSENIHSSLSHSERVDARGRSSYSDSSSRSSSRGRYRSKHIKF